MSGGLGPRLWVAGVDEYGAEQVRLPVRHGDDPCTLLTSTGWSPVAPVDVDARTATHELVFRYLVQPADPATGEMSGQVAVPRDAGLVVAPGEVAWPYQRVAVYGVVLSTRGLLLTQLSAKTNAQGLWGLPGGGLDPDELPEAGLHREVWEETGQRVRITGFEAVTTNHWVGRAPNGRLEDFHAVRVRYRARCDEPSDPVVHDVDGTTQSAAWVTRVELGQLEVTRSWRAVLDALMADPFVL